VRQIDSLLQQQQSLSLRITVMADLIEAVGGGARERARE
jgi:hypothetical protein